MRQIRQHLSHAKIAATLVVFLAVGGVAWAASGTGAAIHACYKQHGGALRVAGHCKRGEKAVSWSRTSSTGPSGPAGAVGASGASGTPGAVGSTGPSDVYAAGTAFGAISTSYASYGQLSLPAGSYLLQAKVILFSTASPSRMACFLTPEGGASKGDLDGAEASAGNNEQNTLSLIGVQTDADATNVVLRCRLLAGSGTIDDAHLVAIKTDSIHGTLPVD